MSLVILSFQRHKANNPSTNAFDEAFNKDLATPFDLPG